jgi:ubiquinone/menaquinone biosynthesis C-methylase UbiE
MVDAIRREHPYPGTFDDAEAYDRFMGRYSVLFAPQLADFAGVAAGQHALDIGCGTGPLTAELARRLRPGTVAALDPSQQFVAAVRERYPDVAVRAGVGEELPFGDGTFDVAVSQLSIGFMDRLAAFREMARVTREGGVVAFSDWYPNRDNPLAPFWRSARALDRGGRAGRRRVRRFIDSVDLFRQAGVRDVQLADLHATVEYARFEEWWLPMTEGVGPTATYVRQLDPHTRERLREHCRARLSDGPFAIAAISRAVRGTVV